VEHQDERRRKTRQGEDPKAAADDKLYSEAEPVKYECLHSDQREEGANVQRKTDQRPYLAADRAAALRFRILRRRFLSCRHRM
jgi:hypothetical protein